MITLSTLIVIAFIISYVRIDAKCKARKETFNPFEGNYLEFLGCIFGGVYIVLILIHLILKYLP